MASKYIDNSTYATSGYTLTGVFKSITIGTEGTIGGPGLLGGYKHAYTIENRGSISGKVNGIDLRDGGLIVNSGTIGSRTNGVGIDITTGKGFYNVYHSGSVVNSGFIYSSAEGVAVDSIDNEKGGRIAGDVYCYNIVSDGTIAGSNGDAVTLVSAFDNYVDTLDTNSLIEGYSGIETTNRGKYAFDSVVRNYGTIISNASGRFDYKSFAADVFSGYAGTFFVNGTHGLIEAIGGTGFGGGGGGTAVNDGTIIGGNARITTSGVTFGVGGTLLNNAGGLIEGAQTGIYLDSCTAVNNGKIEGNASYGALLSEDSTITNNSGGLIQGRIGAVASPKYGPGTTIINFGTIASTLGAPGTAVLDAFASSTLVDEAGSVFIGAVIGGGAGLALAGVGGHLSGLGTSFSGFGSVDVLAGASWTISGGNTLTSGETVSVAGGATLVDTGSIVTSTGLMLGSAGGGAGHFEILAHDTLDLVNAASLRFAVGGDGDTVNNGLFEKTGNSSDSIVRGIFDNTGSGTVAVAAGTLDFSGQIVGSGHISIGATGTVEFDLSVAATQTVSFAGSAATLLLTDVSAFKAAIDGFDAGGSGDSIDVAGFDKGTTVKFTQPKSGETVATLTDGKVTAAVALFGQYSAAGFGYTASSTGTVITYAAAPAEVVLAGATSPSHR